MLKRFNKHFYQYIVKTISELSFVYGTDTKMRRKRGAKAISDLRCRLGRVIPIFTLSRVFRFIFAKPSKTQIRRLFSYTPSVKLSTSPGFALFKAISPSFYCCYLLVCKFSSFTFDTDCIILVIVIYGSASQTFDFSQTFPGPSNPNGFSFHFN